MSMFTYRTMRKSVWFTKKRDRKGPALMWLADVRPFLLIDPFALDDFQRGGRLVALVGF